MGMYDSFYGTIKCPFCEKDVEFSDLQVKCFSCKLCTYTIGNLIDLEDDEEHPFLITLNDGTDGDINKTVCDCGKNIIITAIVLNGQLVAYENDSYDEDVDIRTLPDHYDLIRKFHSINKEVEYIKARYKNIEPTEASYSSSGYNYPALLSKFIELVCTGF